MHNLVHYTMYMYQLKGYQEGWLCSCGSLIYLSNQCLSPITLWVRIPLKWGVLDTTLYDKFVSDLLQVCGFLWVLRFPPPIKLTTTI